MATGKANKKLAAVAVDLPECPVCMETMTAPIFQCQSGHSLCHVCTSALRPPICPICRQQMTQMRNWQLEDIVAKAKVPCPNKSSGCVYIMTASHMDDHLKECIFREMQCPMSIFGRCSWNGSLKEMMDHFKDRHSDNCNINTDVDVELENVDVKEDDRRLYLVAQGKLLFLLTFKTDTLQKMAYIAIQHIGGKTVAKQHIYEVHINSKLHPRRKVVFIDHCFNDTVKADDIFRQSKCAVLPVDMLTNFVKDKKLGFRFFIKRIPQEVTKKGEGNNENKPPSKNKGPGPKQGGHKGPGPRGSGPKNSVPN